MQDEGDKKKWNEIFFSLQKLKRDFPCCCKNAKNTNSSKTFLCCRINFHRNSTSCDTIETPSRVLSSVTESSSSYEYVSSELCRNIKILRILCGIKFYNWHLERRVDIETYFDAFSPRRDPFSYSLSHTYPCCCHHDIVIRCDTKRRDDTSIRPFPFPSLKNSIFFFAILMLCRLLSLLLPLTTAKIISQNKTSRKEISYVSRKTG